MVIINGEAVDCSGKTMKAYLEENGIDTRTIAVELNEDILSKTNFESTVLKDGDVVEIVRFMGGGQ